MTLTQLIIELQEIQAKFADLPVLDSEGFEVKRVTISTVSDKQAE